MKTLQLNQPGGLDHIIFADSEDPGQPNAGEIRVAIKANSLNYHDLLVATGAIPTDDKRVLLSDGAGVVEAVGAGVTEFKVGDAVVSTFFPSWLTGRPTLGNFKQVPGDGIDGHAASVVVRDANAFTHAPRGWSHQQAATITTAGVTAWRALAVDGGIKAGDIVLIQGTGGVSLYALQLAKAAGAQVIATSSSDAKLAHVKTLGADHTINYKDDADWGKTALKLTAGRGVDHVVEVGGPGTMKQSIRALRVGGHIAVIGILTGRDGAMPTMLAIAKQARIQGLMVGSREHQQDLIRAIDSCGITPQIDSDYPAHQLADAFAHQQSGQHLGKITLSW